jgi:hypothetical protein
MLPIPFGLGHLARSKSCGLVDCLLVLVIFSIIVWLLRHMPSLIRPYRQDQRCFGSRTTLRFNFDNMDLSVCDRQRSILLTGRKEVKQVCSPTPSLPILNKNVRDIEPVMWTIGAGKEKQGTGQSRVNVVGALQEEATDVAVFDRISQIPCRTSLTRSPACMIQGIVWIRMPNTSRAHPTHRNSPRTTAPTRIFFWNSSSTLL